jgi:hypothetical protein
LGTIGMEERLFLFVADNVFELKEKKKRRE